MHNNLHLLQEEYFLVFGRQIINNIYIYNKFICGIMNYVFKCHLSYLNYDQVKVLNLFII